MVEPAPDPKRQRLDEEEPDEGVEALDAAAEADGINVVFPADLDADETTLADYASHQDVLDKVRLPRTHGSGLICPSAAWRQQQLGRPTKNMGIMLVT
jgi:2-keto-3-deoxy-L-rhamnonate aldolase RhmA